VASLYKKRNFTLRLDVRHNRSTLDLSLSQQEGTFSSRDSWWTYVGHRIRCRYLLDDNFLLARVSLDGWEGRAAFRPPPDDLDNAILQALDQTPFASMWELAKATCISTATVWRRLTKSLGFVVKHLHWIPYSLPCLAIAIAMKVFSRDWSSKCAQWIFYDCQNSDRIFYRGIFALPLP
jgi:hypothetical protein